MDNFPESSSTPHIVVSVWCFSHPRALDKAQLRRCITNQYSRRINFGVRGVGRAALVDPEATYATGNILLVYFLCLCTVERLRRRLFSHFYSVLVKH